MCKADDKSAIRKTASILFLKAVESCRRDLESRLIDQIAAKITALFSAQCNEITEKSPSKIKMLIFSLTLYNTVCVHF